MFTYNYFRDGLQSLEWGKGGGWGSDWDFVFWEYSEWGVQVWVEDEDVPEEDVCMVDRGELPLYELPQGDFLLLPTLHHGQNPPPLLQDEQNDQNQNSQPDQESPSKNDHEVWLPWESSEVYGVAAQLWTLWILKFVQSNKAEEWIS